MRPTAVSSASPPAISASGSRLPWTGRPGGSSASAQTGSTVSSRPIASTPAELGPVGQMLDTVDIWLAGTLQSLFNLIKR
jgi:hypothetical protein